MTTQQAIKSWIKEHKAEVSIWMNTPEVYRIASELLATTHSQTALNKSKEQVRLRQWLSPLLEAKGHMDYLIIGPDYINLASSREQDVGKKNLLTSQGAFFKQVWSG